MKQFLSVAWASVMRCIIKYFKMMFNVALLTICILIINAPLFFGCYNYVIILLWVVIVIPLVYVIGDWYIQKYLL